MRILGLDRNYLPSLSSRRELATIREIRRIQAEVNHPCHSLLPDPRDKIIYTQFLLKLKDINNLLLLDLLNIYNYINIFFL